jgi:hypothetical protein
MPPAVPPAVQQATPISLGGSTTYRRATVTGPDPVADPSGVAAH